MKNNIKMNQKIDPNWITGFTDAEGNFRLVLTYNKIEKWKYTKRANFTISQKSTSNECLYLIKDFFADQLYKFLWSFQSTYDHNRQVKVVYPWPDHLLHCYLYV